MPSAMPTIAERVGNFSAIESHDISMAVKILRHGIPKSGLVFHATEGRK
jgi:hypothetical protein